MIDPVFDIDLHKPFTYILSLINATDVYMGPVADKAAVSIEQFVPAVTI